MFKFQFSIDEGEEVPELPNNQTKSENNLHWNKCEQVHIGEVSILEDILQNCEKTSSTNETKKETPILYFLNHNDIIDMLRENSISNDLALLAADDDNSDLLSAVYEGGVKIWECTWDMKQYIDENEILFENAKVLDLGCGTGIIGVLCSLKGASSCYFQDYNKEVIKYFTIPNVKLNLKEKIDNCKFYSGDWKSFADILSKSITEEEKFDYIFTVETIYNTDCYPKLHGVFEKLLKSNGKIYLAAKSYYFGVGGGISLFQDFLDSKNIFTHTVCKQYSKGMKREILEIKFKNT